MVKPWLQVDVFSRKELEEVAFVQDTRTCGPDLGIEQEEFENTSGRIPLSLERWAWTLRVTDYLPMGFKPMPVQARERGI